MKTVFTTQLMGYKTLFHTLVYKYLKNRFFFNNLFKLLSILSKLMGYKTVVKYLFLYLIYNTFGENYIQLKLLVY